MSLVDALSAASFPFASPGTRDDIAAGYAKYNCATEAELATYLVSNPDSQFAGIATEDEMVIAFPDALTVPLISGQRFLGERPAVTVTYEFAVFRASAGEWTGYQFVVASTPVVSPFAFAVVNDAVAGSRVESATVILTIANGPAVIDSIAGGEYSIGGGPFGATAGIPLEDQAEIVLAVDASNTPGGQAQVDIVISGVAASFVVNTAAASGDVVAPTISITGGHVNGAVLPAIVVGDAFVAPAAVAVDAVDGVVAVTIDQSAVNVNVINNYNVVYTASDVAGNVATVTLVQPVQAAPDVEGPVITITGGYQDGDVLPGITVGDVFSAPAATANDLVDGVVAVVVDQTDVNAAVAEFYDVIYTASDAAGNVTTVTVILPVEEPVLQMLSVLAPIRDQEAVPGQLFQVDFPANLFFSDPDDITVTLLDGSALPAGFTFVGNRLSWPSPVVGVYEIRVNAIISGQVVGSDYFVLDVLVQTVVANLTVTNDNGVPIRSSSVQWVARESFGAIGVIASGTGATDTAGRLSVPVGGQVGDVVSVSVRRLSDGQTHVEDVVLQAA